MTPPRAGFSRILAAALFVAACSDGVSPAAPFARGGPGLPMFDVASTGDQSGGLNQSGTVIGARFAPTNPHRGDAIIATFFWLGSSVIDSVTDFLTDANSTPVHNTYRLVESASGGGISMATYVALNVQNFPDPSDPPTSVGLAVRANLHTAVTDGGVLLSAWRGVQGISTQHRSASGSGPGPTVAAPGAITLGAGDLAYAVTMSNAVVGRNGSPQGFTNLAVQSDPYIADQADYLTSANGGNADPRWTWNFTQQSSWLATVLALTMTAAPPPPPGSSGNLTASASTTGSSLDPDGYTVAVDGGPGQPIASNGGSVMFSGLATGSHSVSLSGVALNCTVSGGNTQTVMVPSGGTATASFAATCTTPASGGGITLDKAIGTANQSNLNILIKGFDNGNPRHGDALVATFFWLSSTPDNIIDSVTDVVNDANFTRVGNTYHLVPGSFVRSGNVSMATYVATNIQNFPDTNQTPHLAVRANLRETVVDGGLQLSAWSGVTSDFTQAMGASNSAFGSGTTYTADPGAIDIGAGALAYGASLVFNSGLLDHASPPEFTILNVLSDTFHLIDEANYLVSASGRSVDPQWRWQFSQPSTWLATVLALNPGGAPQPPPPPATHVAFTTQPQTTQAGQTMPAVRVSALDDAGNVVTGFTGSITVALGSNPSGGTLSGTTNVTAVSGVATFSTLSINSAGNGYTLTASGSGLTGATSTAFNITAAPPPPATNLAFTTQPSSTQANQTMAAVRVTARDASGNTVTGFTGTITIALGANPGGGTLSGTTNVAAVNGVATFSTLSINNAGNGYTLVANATGLTGTTSTAFNITAAPPPPATNLAFTTQPTSTQAGQTMAAVRVTARDASGNAVPGFTGTITVALGANPGGGTLSGTTSVAAVNGVATFSTLSINNAGNGYTLVANASGLTGATSTAFNITAPPPPPATNLAFTTQPASTQANQTMAAVRVTARDASGNAVLGFTGTITVALGANPGGGILSGTTSVTAVNGVATFSTLSINNAGNGYTLVANASGLTGATSTAFNITAPPPPPATNVAFTTQPASTQANQTMAAVRVTARDASGNAVPGFTGTITVALGANPGGGTLSGTTSVAAVNGVATFSTLSINNAGTGYTLVASASGLTGATSAAFNITAPPPPPATNLAVTTQPQTTVAGQTMSVVRVTARDASGNAVTGYTGLITVALGANPGGGTLSGTKSVNAVSGVATFSTLSINNAGTGYTLVASASGLTGATSAAFNITTPPNSAPVVNAGADEHALTGLLWSTSFSFSDANGNGPWSYRIAWGDGSVSTGTRTTQGSFTVSHTYVIILPRSFTITATVTDAAGASGSDSKIVSVTLL